LLFSLFILFVSLPSLAQRDLEADYPGVGGSAIESVSTTLPEYVKYVFNFAIWIAGALSLFFLVYGGFLYLTSAGNPSKMQDAKDQIIASLLGIAILGGSYAILNTINPALTKFETPDLEKFEIPEIIHHEFKPEILTEINVEIPPETIIKEKLFEEERMKKIMEFGVELTELAEDSIKNSLNLQNDSQKCKCDYGSDPPPGCTRATCVGKCEKEETEDGKIKCIDSCRGESCTSDPCCQVREDIDENKVANRTNISEGFLPLIKEAEKEVQELNLDMDRLKKSMSLISDCDFLGGNLKTFDQFKSSKGYYMDEKDIKVKQIEYWEEIDPGSNPVSFYCSVGGTIQNYLGDSSDMSEEEIIEYYDSALQTEENFDMSCSIPIPFGELVDKSLATTTELIGEIEKIIQTGEKMIEAIDLLHQKVSECTSIHCSPVCCCGVECKCDPCGCVGSPCPDEEIRKAVEKIQEVYKGIEKIQDKIEEIIKEGIPEIKENLSKLEERTRVCVSEEKVAPGAVFLNCESSIGCIGPGGYILQNSSMCSCSASAVCEEEFPVLDNYSCQILGDCNEFNFFCCRLKD